MRKIFPVLLTLFTAFVSCQKYDDTAVWDELKDHEERITELETLCNRLNTNITSLQSIVTALQNNDYVTSVSTITDNGKDIGYTINFSKSGAVNIYHGKDGMDGAPGTDGVNGTPGKDGVDGAPGQDGASPVIGVKVDTDGIYYWTLNGEWLLDQEGNKIPTTGKDGAPGQNGTDGAPGQNGEPGQDGAPGQDGKPGQDGAPGQDGKPGQDGAAGKDGVTPRLKIEDGYWFVSYDNGVHWEKAGKATGDNGAAGAGGDSFFKGVTQDQNNVYLELADGTTITIPLATSYLFNKIQSVNYIPAYHDGAATLIYGDYSDSVVEMDFEVYPKAVLEDIQKNWEKLLSLKAVYTLTRSDVTFIDMPITSCRTDKEKGILSITAEGKNLSEDFFKGTKAANARLSISDEENSIASAYIPLVSEQRKPLNYEIWYTSIDDEPITLLSSDFDADIVSNTYANGKGVVRFDKELKVMNPGAFNSKDKLASVNLPNSIEEIGMLVFNNCNNLAKVNLPKNLKTIGARAFSYCSVLAEIKLPGTVKVIESNAFGNCILLETVHLPNSLERIGTCIFFGCKNMRKFTGKFASEDGSCIIYNETLNSLAQYNLTSYTIPSNVKHIGDDAFRATSVKDLKLHDKVESIGLRSIARPITEIRLPASIKEIKSHAFGMSDIVKCYIEATVPPTAVIAEGFSVWKAFNVPEDELVIYVPASSLEAYKTAEGWNEYADRFQSIENAE